MRCHHCGQEEFAENPKLLWTAFWVTFIFFVIELAGGIFANSLALIADSFHMATDALAILIGAGASYLARRRGFSPKIKAWAAMVNAIFLLALAVVVAKEAYERFYAPREIISLVMFTVSFLGLGINVFSEKILRHQAIHDLNTRAVYWHIYGDLMSSVSTIFAALVIIVWNWTPADALAALVVAALMVITGCLILVESISKLFEKA